MKNECRKNDFQGKGGLQSRGDSKQNQIINDIHLGKTLRKSKDEQSFKNRHK